MPKRVGSNRLSHWCLVPDRGAGYWLQSEEVKGAGLKGRKFGNELEGAGAISLEVCGVSATGGEFGEQSLEAVKR